MYLDFPKAFDSVCHQHIPKMVWNQKILINIESPKWADIVYDMWDTTLQVDLDGLTSWSKTNEPYFLVI